MPILFPSDEWIKALKDQLNASASYAEIAKNWEGDFYFHVDWPSGAPPTLLYIDLWHGKCRDAFLVTDANARKPAFRLSASIGNFARVIKGELDPLQAMVTGKIKVQGNMVMMMKNIPTVLEFVRVCQQIESVFTDA
jgi:putative sterol carrier protein